MQVAALNDPVCKNDVDVFAQNVGFTNQSCLMSSSDEKSVASERFLHDRLDSFGGEGSEKIVEVDPIGMLALLGETIVGQRDDVEEAVGRREHLRLGDMDRILQFCNHN